MTSQRTWDFGETVLVATTKRHMTQIHSSVISQARNLCYLLNNTVTWGEIYKAEGIATFIKQTPIEEHHDLVDLWDHQDNTSHYHMLQRVRNISTQEISDKIRDHIQLLAGAPRHHPIWDTVRHLFPTKGEIIQGIRRILTYAEMIQSQVLNQKTNPNRSPERQAYLIQHRSQESYLNWSHRHLWSTFLPKAMLGFQQPKLRESHEGIRS
jgi:hypothetical protein